MDISYFLTFKAILETGSFQNAANKLGYSQSTITSHVKQMEHEFSIKLFEKIGRRMVLTQAGNDILPHVDKLLESVHAIRNYGEGQENMSGTLRVAMPESLLVYKMQSVLKEFKRIAPDVSLCLHTYSCYTINSYILNGEIDIGLQYNVEGYTGHINVEELEDIDLTMVSSADYKPGPFAERMAETSLIVSHDPADACRVIVRDYLKEAGIKPRDMIELGSTEAIKRSVMNDLGIAYLPRYSISEELKESSLMEIDTGISGKVVTVICAYHQNKWVSPAMELFIRLAKNGEV